MTMGSVLRYFLSMVLLALATAPGLMAVVLPGGRMTHRINSRQGTQKSDHAGFGLSLVCIPTTTQTIQDHEGRHRCAYDHPSGFRAVGVGYNLDDDVETRKSELASLFLDYDEVYRGETCLWEVQVSTLLTMDARRALNKVAESVEPLEDFCCEVQAVFADVQHSIGGDLIDLVLDIETAASKSFEGKDLKGFVAKASRQDWKSAARELEQTDWCKDNEKRCEDNIDIVKSGCNMLFGLRTWQ